MELQLVVQVRVDVRAPKAEISPPVCFSHDSSRFCAQNSRHRRYILLPGCRFFAQRSPARGRQAIELRAFALFGESPLALHPPTLFHPMQGGVQRTVDHVETALRGGTDESSDGIAVLRLSR